MSIVMHNFCVINLKYIAKSLYNVNCVYIDNKHRRCRQVLLFSYSPNIPDFLTGQKILNLKQ